MKTSAGLLLYRQRQGAYEVLLVHPGGPFWAKKEAGAWSIPKGEFENDDALTEAKREFHEELGQKPPSGEYHKLGVVKNKSGKVIHAWAVEGELNAGEIHSNTFRMEWPPRSGREQEFPEVDKAGWFGLDEALIKLNPAQTAFIERLADLLQLKPPRQPEQTTLL